MDYMEVEWIRRILLDNTPLELQAMAPDNPIIIHSLLFPVHSQLPVQTATLVNSGSSSYKHVDT